MKIRCTEIGPFTPAFFKFITVKKLAELLENLRDEDLLNCQSIANTGDLGIYRRDDPEAPIEKLRDAGDLVGTVRFGEEKVDFYEF